MLILGYAIRDNIIADSRGNVRSGPPYLDFLLSEPDAIRVFHNMKHDVAHLARTLKLTAEEGRKLIRNKQLYLPPYTIRYLPRRFLSIKYGHGRRAPFASFSDMAQYADSSEYIDDPLLAAKEAAAIAGEVYSALQSLGLYPRSLASPIRVWERNVMEHMDLPTVDDLPEPRIGYYALMCSQGPWTEAYKLGHFTESYDYDIRSCYGYFTSQLPDFRTGEWIQDARYHPEAALGYVKGTITVDSSFSPILFKHGHRNYTPTGTWPAYLTKEQLEFLYCYNIGEFTIEDGYWWIADGTQLPLERTVMELHQYKEKSSGMVREVVKRILAGMWGKMMESRMDGLGRFFNPVWGAEVETRAALKVARFILDNDLTDSLLHVAVDGVLTARHVPLHEEGIGTWKLTAQGPCLVVSSGAVGLACRKSGGDFAIDYHWLVDSFSSHPGETRYMLAKRAPLTITRALDSWHRLAEIETITKAVDTTSEAKRFYPEMPRCGGDLLHHTYHSLPWDVSLLQQEEFEEEEEEE